MVGRVHPKLCGTTTKSVDKMPTLGEFCYNTTFHMSIGMPPFRELYGFDALTFFEMIFGDSISPKAKYWVEESQ